MIKCEATAILRRNRTDEFLIEAICGHHRVRRFQRLVRVVLDINEDGFAIVCAQAEVGFGDASALGLLFDFDEIAVDDLQPVSRAEKGSMSA